MKRLLLILLTFLFVVIKNARGDNMPEMLAKLTPQPPSPMPAAGGSAGGPPGMEPQPPGSAVVDNKLEPQKPLL